MLKNNFNRFYSKIFEILDKDFFIFPITLDRVDKDSTINRSEIEAYNITYFFRKIPGGFGENLKKPRRWIDPPLVFLGLIKVFDNQKHAQNNIKWYTATKYQNKFC